MGVGGGADDDGVDVGRRLDLRHVTDLATVFVGNGLRGGRHRIGDRDQHGTWDRRDGIGMHLTDPARAENGKSDCHGMSFRKLRNCIPAASLRR